MLTVGLVAPATAIIATSGTTASAATATRIVSGYESGPAVRTSTRPATVGDNVYAAAYAVDANGNRVTEGTVFLQRQLAGEGWKNLAAGGTSYVIETSKAVKNANYRIYYTGSANFTASVSPVIKIAVARKITSKDVRGNRAGITGKVAPKAKVKIVIKKKVGNKFKKFRTQRTTSKGRFTIILPAPRKGRFHWKITFKGSQGYSSSVIKGSTYKL